LIAWLARRLLVVVVILALPLVIGELLARKLIGDAVASTLAARFGGSPRVGFGSKPLLLELLDGHLDELTVSDARAHLGGLPPVALSASFRDVHVTSLTALRGATGPVTVRASLDATVVRDLLAVAGCTRSLPADVSEALGADPRILLLAGHVSLLPVDGDAAELRLVPVLFHDAVAFRVIGVLLAGAAVPVATLRSVAAGTDCVRPLGSLPFNLRLDGVTAAPGAVQLDLRAAGASFAVG
jgi:hypothetical protein